METTAEVEVTFEDYDVWSAVEDNVRESIQEQAWDVVRDEVYECAEQAAQDYISNNDIGEGVSESDLERLLDELSRRIEQDLSLCSLGQSAKKAITLIAQQVVAEPFATGSTPTSEAIKLENTTQIAENAKGECEQNHSNTLLLSARLDDLETQVRALLNALIDSGERAASVDRR